MPAVRLAMLQKAFDDMMRDLEERPQLWVWALPEITGADPVPAADRGNIRKMSAVWLQWGREHGYQW